MICICLNLDPVTKILYRQMGLNSFFLLVGNFGTIKHYLDFSFVFSAPLPA